MEIDLGMFDSGIADLEFVVHHPAFRLDDWTTALPLLPIELVERLDLWEEQSPGARDAFKLALQYVLNRWDDATLDRFFNVWMDFALPTPSTHFLKYVWEAIYPGEPWKRNFPDTVTVIQRSNSAQLLEIDLRTFNGLVAWLEFVVNHPDFDEENWNTAHTLLPAEFVRKVELADAKHSGKATAFKLAFQYVLNTWDESQLERFWDQHMDFSLPEPPMQFLQFVWEAIYPGEPWQRSFPADVKVCPA